LYRQSLFIKLCSLAIVVRVASCVMLLWLVPGHPSVDFALQYYWTRIPNQTSLSQSKIYTAVLVRVLVRHAMLMRAHSQSTKNVSTDGKSIHNNALRARIKILIVRTFESITKESVRVEYPCGLGASLSLSQDRKKVESKSTNRKNPLTVKPTPTSLILVMSHSASRPVVKLRPNFALVFLYS
jgi:hypothetical protein